MSDLNDTDQHANLSDLLKSKQEQAKASDSIDKSFNELIEANAVMVNTAKTTFEKIDDAYDQLKKQVNTLQSNVLNLAEDQAGDHRQAIEDVRKESNEAIRDIQKARKGLIQKQQFELSLSSIFTTFGGLFAFVMMLSALMINLFFSSVYVIPTYVSSITDLPNFTLVVLDLAILFWVLVLAIGLPLGSLVLASVTVDKSKELMGYVATLYLFVSAFIFYFGALYWLL